MTVATFLQTMLMVVGFIHLFIDPTSAKATVCLASSLVIGALKP